MFNVLYPINLPWFLLPVTYQKINYHVFDGDTDNVSVMPMELFVSCVGDLLNLVG